MVIYKKLSFIMAVVFGAMINCGGFAAVGEVYQCEDPDTYPYINPALTLCEIHPYNMGWENVENKSGADKARMKEVIGLKTTIITQQMKRQYDNLEGIVRKLKTQLEKPVLTSNLEAAGAKSEKNGGGASSSGDKSIILAGAQNCLNSFDRKSAFECARANISLIINNSSASTNKACKQLNATFDGVKTWLGINDGVLDENKCKFVSSNGLANCDKNTVVSCSQILLQKIAYEEEQQNLKEAAAKAGGSWK
ncbi:MAG: hypothetical protein MJ158_01105 [Alphaproteobacteria bacterium]|nr:hypothetical protein [Alphaproteobacteria bacterium]